MYMTQLTTGKLKIEPKLLPIDCSLPGDMEEVKRVQMLLSNQTLAQAL